MSIHLDPKDNAYWREVPHPFSPAPWGRKYCLLCADPKSRSIHLDRGSMDRYDPRATSGQERPTGLWQDVWWKVEAWNPDDKGGSCSYGFDHRKGPMKVRSDAEEYLAHLMEHGDDDGRRYDHYAVVEYRHTSVCTTLVHDVKHKEQH